MWIFISFGTWLHFILHPVVANYSFLIKNVANTLYLFKFGCKLHKRSEAYLVSQAGAPSHIEMSTDIVRTFIMSLLTVIFAKAA
jgi:hypothetical protein